MPNGSLIETGVDKLVNLVRQHKKISVAEAAKQLGVSTIVVEEWADFLEEEGIISIEYKFTTPYLVERLLSKEEILRKEKEFGGKKEAFVRKAEVTLALLDKETESFQKVRDQFEDLKKELASEVKHVKGDLKDLEKYDELKSKISEQIEKQQKDFREKISEIERQVSIDEKKYADILGKIGAEEQKLDKEKMMALSIRERENVLRQRVDDFRKMVDKIEESIESEDKLVVDSEEHIAELKDLAEDVKRNVAKKKELLDEVFEDCKEEEEKIAEMQEQILKKANAKKAEIERRIAEGKGASKQFRDFFDKKAEIDRMIESISRHKNELEKELIDLIHKAKAFTIASKSRAVGSQINALKKKFRDIDKKKASFEKDVKKLASLIKK